jgi:hypothetical protein
MWNQENRNTNRLYVRLHNLFVYLFIQRFSRHVSVVYDHNQVVFTCTLTPVFLLFLPTLADVYIWRNSRKIGVSVHVKTAWWWSYTTETCREKRCINKYTRKLWRRTYNLFTYLNVSRRGRTNNFENRKHSRKMIIWKFRKILATYDE